MSTAGSPVRTALPSDGRRRMLYPSDVTGRFVRWRGGLSVVLITIYLSLPFVRIGGNPAILLDIPGRRFYLFGALFDAQDTWMSVFLVLSLAFGLLFFTAWMGRVFCGWLCPQTVFLEWVYRRIERWLAGNGRKRLLLETEPWTGRKVALKVVEQALFLALSWGLGHVFLTYFVGADRLWAMILEGPSVHWVTFLWGMGLSGLVYFNFAYFREQLCVVVCPYGRFQSILTDHDSIIIGYDRQRGEPRGKLSKRASAGDCIDCRRCVVVCPTGIDIREGLQMECVGCARCIDACDEMMVRVKRPTGLLRYDAQTTFEGRRARVLRPRLLAYGVLFAAALVALATSLWTRTNFDASLIRSRAAPWVLEEGVIRNQFELHLVNKHPTPETFHIVGEAVPGASFTIPLGEVRLAPLESFRTPIFVTMPQAAFRGPFEVRLKAIDTEGHEREAYGRFLGPSPGGR